MRHPDPQVATALAWFTGGAAIGVWVLSLKIAAPIELVGWSFVFLLGIKVAEIWKARTRK